MVKRVLTTKQIAILKQLALLKGKKFSEMTDMDFKKLIYLVAKKLRLI